MSAIRLNKEQLYTVSSSIFVAVILISTIASSKIVGLGPFVFDAGTVLFPLSYVIGSILTEVYGLKRAELVIVVGVLTQLLASVTFIIVGLLPTQTDWHNQDAYMAILGIVPRIAIASIIAYFVGEFFNVRFLNLLKKTIKNRSARIVIALLLAQIVDTLLFSTIAFTGTMPMDVFWSLVGTVLIIKIIVVSLLAPISSGVISLMQRVKI